MTTPAIAPESNPSRLKGISHWIDPLSKGIAGLAIALYACGFLVVSIYHSQYGFVGVSPFRPRILAAGAWFFFFTLIPFSAAMNYRDAPWTKIARDVYPIWVACLGVSIFLLYILFNTSDYPAASSPHKYWWVWLLAGLIAVGVVILLGQLKKLPSFVSVATSVGLTLFSIQSAARALVFSHAFRLDTLTLWFFAVTMVTINEWKLGKRRKLLAGVEWPKPLVTLFVALLAFAHYYYPHLKSSWGGGAPVEVTICFTKDSAISPTKTVSAELIEEADEGFYIVGPNESKAFFLPRSSVAYIYFSPKLSDSQLVH